ASIYVLIAGSYTPFCLVILPEKTGWYLFIFVWLFALLGVVLKLFFTGKYDKLSTILYLIMGWQVLFLIKPLMDNLASEGLFFLIAGGIFYTIGAVLYSIKKVPYNHAIFHVFVLLGSFSHFWAIFKYV
ncbi:PAQR family membrane homeostasis protein TrhA, partial [Tenacibaculum piscium]